VSFKVVTFAGAHFSCLSNLRWSGAGLADAGPAQDRCSGVALFLEIEMFLLRNF
jgi:hypothetical protein